MHLDEKYLKNLIESIENNLLIKVWTESNENNGQLSEGLQQELNDYFKED